MTNKELIHASFLEFIFISIEEMKSLDPELTEIEAAHIVMGTVFESLSKTWLNAYGAKYMAEYFYRVADQYVDISNEEVAK